jgi:hypothetical protein
MPAGATSSDRPEGGSPDGAAVAAGELPPSAVTPMSAASPATAPDVPATPTEAPAARPGGRGMTAMSRTPASRVDPAVDSFAPGSPTRTASAAPPGRPSAPDDPDEAGGAAARAAAVALHVEAAVSSGPEAEGVLPLAGGMVEAAPERSRVSGWLRAEGGAGLRQGTAGTGSAALAGGVQVERGVAVGVVVSVAPRTAIPALGEAPRAGGWDGALLAAWSPDLRVAPWIGVGFGLSQRRFTEDGALVTSAVVPFVLGEADLRVRVVPALSVVLGASMTVDLRSTITRLGSDGADHPLSIVGVRPGAGILLHFGAR